MEEKEPGEIKCESAKTTKDAGEPLSGFSPAEARWYEKIWWRAAGAWDSLKYGVKWKAQRVFRGYSDNEVWNLGYASARYILPRLEAFANGAIAYPPEYDTFEEWKADLGKMIAAFDWVANLDEREDELVKECGGYFAKGSDGKPAWTDRMAEKRKEVDEGMALFGRNILYLCW